MIKPNFSKIWTTEYSLFSVWLFGREYAESCKKEIGKGFENIIFSISENLATVYRANEETRNFSRFLADRIINDDEFCNRVFERDKKLADNIYEILAISPSEFLEKETLDRFIDIHAEFLPYFLTILWSPNEFEYISAADSKKDEIFKACEKRRKETENIYPDIEKYLQEVFRYIGDRENLDWNFLRAMLPEEFYTYVEIGKLPAIFLLKERYRKSVVISDFKNNKLITGEEADEFINSLIYSHDGKIKEIKGTVANNGVVKGNVSIIFSDKDGAKIKDGNIIVTTMTRPEWLPFMKKASAYVTDAGGVLCHAAITARELKKPCIIGTKIATQVLKDGDLVEVDANAGVVKILKRADGI